MGKSKYPSKEAVVVSSETHEDLEDPQVNSVLVSMEFQEQKATLLCLWGLLRARAEAKVRRRVNGAPELRQFKVHREEAIELEKKTTEVTRLIWIFRTTSNLIRY